jgi:hypothetical protein
LIRTRSVNRVHEVRVTARAAVAPLARGNSWDDHRTAPIMPRVPEGPRSRSGYFHSLPCPVSYRDQPTRPATSAVTVRLTGTAPPATTTGGRLRRGWPGRKRALAS